MHILLISLAALFIYMCTAYVVSLIRKDNGTADIAYGLGFVLVTWLTYYLGSQSIVGIIAGALVSIWATRLSVRIFLRSRGKPEDFRYLAWREAWGNTFLWKSFLQIYMLQGILLFVVVLPITILNVYGSEAGLGLIGLVGLILWVIGFLFETIGDAQLDSFLKNPNNKGHVMDTGLWRYTRHPNYFGESLMWWGLALLAFDTLSVSGISMLLALLPFIGPALITFLLLKVSGVPLLEARFAGNTEWEVYKKRTSVFIPLAPKK